MKNLAIILSLALACLGAGNALAAGDDYIGDTAIYSGESSNLRPNVLFIVDTSQDMEQSGGTEPYDPATTYPGSYTKNAVYKKLNQSNWQLYVDPNADGTIKVTCAEVLADLTDYGFSNRNLARNTGACGGKNDDGDFYLGNLLNKITATPGTPAGWVTATSYAVGDVVKPSDASNTNTYRCITAGTSGAAEPTWPTTAGATVTDGTVVWEVSSDLLSVVQTVLKQVAGPLREQVKMGLMTFGTNNHGGYLKAGVKPLGVADKDKNDNLVGPANYTAFLNAVDGMTLVSSNSSQPVNETLWDARLYFAGQNDNNTKFSSDTFVAASPLENSCDRNFVIVLTTGSSTPSSQAANAMGDLDTDGTEGGIDDAAKLLYESDFWADDASNVLTEGDQVIQTTVIQLMTSKVAQLEEATDSTHGRGTYYNPTNTNQLIDALLDAMGNIVAEANTSFVAPVVPASTTNRTISSNRIYLGLFQPQVQKPWLGNLKKYGVNSSNQLVDKNGDVATYADGSFYSDKVSYWGTNASNLIVKFNGTLNPASGQGDGGQVAAGGVGGTLVARIQGGTARKLYTNVGASADLTDSGNAFSKANLTAANTGIADDVVRDKLVDYFQGVDVEDDDEDGSVTDTRPWIMGDILHSKPVIFNYTEYATAKENTCFKDDSTANSTMIFVGANDGMLHAFRDCDGGEEWAFIPDSVLPALPELFGTSHNYFVDSSPVLYVHDQDGDGQVDTGVGKKDRVILLFGQRRGGGKSTLSSSGSRGAYYALDVTTYNAPKLLWKIDSTTTDFGELGETWSQPRLAKIKVGSAVKVVAIVGAGYDNNEDLRFGNTQAFPSGITDTTDTTLSSNDDGNVTSTGGGSQVNARGRGVFMIEVAELKTVSGQLEPDFTNSGQKLWKYTNAEDATNMTFSMPSDVTVLDSNADGYHDRIYVGDTGGRMWRFDISSTDPNSWTANIIFRSNPGHEATATNGRKFFFKPSITKSGSNHVLFFGSGDRAHPLNAAVTDRIYAVKDKGQATVDDINEKDDLVNVTANDLQKNDTTASAIDTILDGLTNKHGWFIDLDENSGEKVLAPALVFNQNVFFTTYAPNTSVVPDPCNPGNLGTARIYHLNFATGEAIVNYDTSNDSSATSGNKRAAAEDGAVLRRSDRVKNVGSGIPSEPTTQIDVGGKVTIINSVSEKVLTFGAPDAKLISPVYWMRW